MLHKVSRFLYGRTESEATREGLERGRTMSDVDAKDHGPKRDEGMLFYHGLRWAGKMGGALMNGVNRAV